MVIFFRTFYTMIHWMLAWIFSIALNVRGRQPYAVFDTLYPPLANLFFYALFLLVPASVSDNWTYDFEASVAMRGTETDLRTTQSCFLLYVFFVVLAVLLLAVLLRDVMQNAQWARASTFFALFSFGVLNAVDRGNIILLAAGLSLFFRHVSPFKARMGAGTGIGCTGSSSRT